MTSRPSALSKLLSRLPANVNELGLMAAVLVVLALTALFDTQGNYLSDPLSSAQDILRQTSLLGIFALGSAIVIISGGIDLSCGSVIAFSGTTCATIMLMLAPEEMREFKPIGGGVIAAAISGTILVGLLIGSLHAWLITRVGLPPFVATLASLVGLRSLGRAVIENATQAQLGARSTQIQIFDDQFRDLTTSPYTQGIVFALLAVGFSLMLSRTITGRHLYALGGNEAAARLSGIRTDRLKWLAYVLGATCSSIAGILYIGDQGTADPQTLGVGYELNAIAAAVVGGCSLQGGVGTIFGTVLGCLFLRVVMDGIAKVIDTGADVYEGSIVGILVVLAVAFNQLRQAAPGRTPLLKGPLGGIAGLTVAALLAMLVGFLFGIAAAFYVLGALALLLVSRLAWKFLGQRDSGR
jgi:ribose/xylose/arabinose/galactoside ABC-type transport system permease subunit